MIELFELLPETAAIGVIASCVAVFSRTLKASQGVHSEAIDGMRAVNETQRAQAEDDRRDRAELREQVAMLTTRVGQQETQLVELRRERTEWALQREQIERRHQAEQSQLKETHQVELAKINAEREHLEMRVSRLEGQLNDLGHPPR